MAWELHNEGDKFPYKAASAVLPKQPVALDTVQGQVVPLATTGVQAEGLSIASVAQGGGVAVYGRGNIVKAVAAASLGFGGAVGCATTGGQLGPIGAAASGVAKFKVGEARENAAAGETFALFVNPGKLDAQF